MVGMETTPSLWVLKFTHSLPHYHGPEREDPLSRSQEHVYPVVVGASPEMGD